MDKWLDNDLSVSYLQDFPGLFHGLHQILRFAQRIVPFGTFLTAEIDEEFAGAFHPVAYFAIDCRSSANLISFFPRDFHDNGHDQ